MPYERLLPGCPFSKPPGRSIAVPLAAKFGLSLSSGFSNNSSSRSGEPCFFPPCCSTAGWGWLFSFFWWREEWLPFFSPSFPKKKLEKKRESEIASPVAAVSVISRELEAEAEKAAEKEPQVREELKDVEEAPPAEGEEKTPLGKNFSPLPAVVERAVTPTVPIETKEVADESEKILATPIDEQAVATVEIEAERKKIPSLRRFGGPQKT
ncbi:MAG: hypothetical protein PWQ91_1516 [Eubacteriales bacterium]|nr:hypothetical protein [Eubacteriales bacterium]